MAAAFILQWGMGIGSAVFICQGAASIEPALVGRVDWCRNAAFDGNSFSLITWVWNGDSGYQGLRVGMEGML